MLYNLGLFFVLLLISPKILYQRIFHKKFKGTLLWRLGLKRFFFSVPDNKKVLWIHAVSLGETKSGLIFLDYIKKEYPNLFVVYSTVTQTGMEALKKDPLIDISLYLPLDFSWTMRRLTKKIRPHFLCLVETDIWPHFLKYIKPYAKIFLISAKLSDRSFKRFKIFSYFTKKLFSYFDHICVQSKQEYQKFIDLNISPKKIDITGNLKYDHKKQFENLDLWREKFLIQDNTFVLTIASTHEQEEILILDQLKPFFHKIKILLAPRHPERFSKVKKVIETYETDNIILIDEMGLLHICFQLSRVAIVGGSFVPHIGGHNILEPSFYQIPVLFGPNMQNQKELVIIARNYQLGWQINLKQIPDKIEYLMQTPFVQTPKFAKEIQGSSQKTVQALTPYFSKKSDM